MNTVVENRIYSGWAFTENEREKAKVNLSIYEQLHSKYKVYRNDLKINLTDGEDLNFDDYDVIIGRKPCYHHGEYKVYKNKPNLTKDELALLCDTGNLCFGYRTMGTNGFYVFED